MKDRWGMARSTFRTFLSACICVTCSLSCLVRSLASFVGLGHGQRVLNRLFGPHGPAFGPCRGKRRYTQGLPQPGDQLLVGRSGSGWHRSPHPLGERLRGTQQPDGLLFSAGSVEDRRDPSQAGGALHVMGRIDNPEIRKASGCLSGLQALGVPRPGACEIVLEERQIPQAPQGADDQVHRAGSAGAGGDEPLAD
jgi:hypothetical protein